MSYIGKEPIVGNFQKCDAITVVNGQAAYTLQVGSTNVIPESVNHMIVSLNGVIQSPTTAYSVAGATLTFASNLATGDVIDFVILLGNVLDIGTPSDGTVTNAKLAQDIISGETALTSAPAATDELLISDAGTLKRIDYSLIGNVPFFYVKKSSAGDQAISDATTTKVTYDTTITESSTDIFDLTNNKFTCAVAGTYLISVQSSMYDGDNKIKRGDLYIYKNGTIFKKWTHYDDDGYGREYTGIVNFPITLAATDYLEVYVFVDTTDNGALVLESDSEQNSISGIKLS